MGALLQWLPVIIQTITTGTELLAKWQTLANAPGGPTDEQLATFAQEMEAALAESQAALRGEPPPPAPNP